MKQPFKYKFHPKVVVRTPRKPISIEINEQILKENFSKTIEKEAIFLASPHLYDATTNWLSSKELEPKEKRKLIHSLAKYYIRSTTRPTPFGLFSGVSTMLWGESTNVNFGMDFARHTRLDMNYLCEFAKNISQIPVVKERLVYYQNSSIYSLKNEYRYVEIYFENNKRVHQITAIQKQKYIDKTIKLIGKKGAKYSEIVNGLVDDKISEEEASAFLDQLIEAQLINSQLEPTVTGIEYTYKIIEILESINWDANPFITNLLDNLKKIDFCIKKIDENKINEVKAYTEIIDLIAKNDRSFDINNLFQTDLITLPTSQSTINSNFQPQIIELIEFLRKIDLSTPESNLQKFKNSFSERYQEQEVPILEALDIENGIGYADKLQGDFTPLIDGIDFSIESKNIYEFSNNQQKLFEKLIDANNSQLIEIDLLTIKFMEIDEINLKPMPPSFNVLFREIEYNKILIDGLGGSSAATLLGRFAHVDENINIILNEIIGKEELINSEVIFAEIAHLPENRTGNVIAHPCFRKYEIPFLAKPNVSSDFQIQLSDLYLSIVDNDLILRSKKHNKVIVPRLSNAHNYSNDALPIYQFLCDLQCQNTFQYLNFDWGNIANGFKFLPRIVFKNIVLSPATWLLYKADFENVNSSVTLLLLLKKRKIPDLFVLTEGDNELLISIESELLLEVFLGMAKNSERTIIKEAFQYSKSICSEKTSKVFANQIVASVINLEKIYSNNVVEKTESKERNFDVGSEWIYYKIYCGARAADNILLNGIFKLVKSSLKLGLIKSWFFIRYNDPQPHLRLRFQMVDSAKLNEFIKSFNDILLPFRAENIAWKVQIDTYERELERYGFDTIEFHEKLFCNSSEAIINFLNKNRNENIEMYKWLFGIKLCDITLSLFNYNLNQKLEALKKLKESFGSEFNIKKEQKLVIDSKYRAHKAKIFEFLEGNGENFAKIFQNFEKKSIGYISEILIKPNNAELLERSILSQLHMHVNRIISSKQRHYELIIYDFLYRYYLSKKARKDN